MDYIQQHSDELVKRHNDAGLKINQLREKLVLAKINFEEVVECPTEAAITCFIFIFDNKCIYLSLSSNDDWCLSNRKHKPSYIFCCSHDRAINSIDWNNQLKSFT